jgi:hypothetical protein
MSTLDRFKAFMNSGNPVRVIAPDDAEKDAPLFANQFVKKMIVGAMLATQIFSVAAATEKMSTAPVFNPPAATVQMEVNPAAKAIGDVFAKYLANGRSSSEVLITAHDGTGTAEGLKAHTGSVNDKARTCVIEGVHAEYKAPQLDAGESLHLDSQAMRHGVVIHEYTHCQTVPHMGLASKAEKAGVQSLSSHEQIKFWHAQDIKHVASESIADARTVLLLASRDGLDAAREYTNKMSAARSSTDLDHQTQVALKAALTEAQTNPGILKNDREILIKSIEIGKTSAIQTVRHAVNDMYGPKEIRTNMLDSASDYESNYAKTLLELDQSLQGAIHEYDSGKYETNTVTVDAPGASYEISSSSEKVALFRVIDDNFETSVAKPAVAMGSTQSSVVAPLKVNPDNTGDSLPNPSVAMNSNEPALLRPANLSIEAGVREFWPDRINEATNRILSQSQSALQYLSSDSEKQSPSEKDGSFDPQAVAGIIKENGYLAFGKIFEQYIKESGQDAFDSQHGQDFLARARDFLLDAEKPVQSPVEKN